MGSRMQKVVENRCRPSDSNRSHYEKRRIRKTEIWLLLTFLMILTVITLFDSNIERSESYREISKLLGGMFLAVPVFFAYTFKRL